MAEKNEVMDINENVVTTVSPRVNVTFPPVLYDELLKIAKEESMKPTEIIRQFMKMGLIAYKIQKTEGQRLIMQDGDEVVELRLIV